MIQIILGLLALRLAEEGCEIIWSWCHVSDAMTTQPASPEVIGLLEFSISIRGSLYIWLRNYPFFSNLLPSILFYNFYLFTYFCDAGDPTQNLLSSLPLSCFPQLQIL
jgi:hypothetical protein